MSGKRPTRPESSASSEQPGIDELERARVRAAAYRTIFGGGEPVRLGRFELGPRIGAGAMGVVYSARDPELHRTVALKVLDAGDNGERGRERLAREAQALARLSHPNVVAVHEIGHDAGVVFIAMELVEGDRLDVWAARVSPGWREKLRVLLEAGAGIAAAHEQALVHRDVKPSNIVVDGKGRARVVDFGLARADQPVGPVAAGVSVSPSGTRTRGFAGTPAYAAPEQLEGGVADARSDQYAFAATAWEALTGSPPFGGATVEERLTAIRTARWEPARDTVPEAVLSALRRALGYDPAGRYESVSALMVALGAAAGRPSRRTWVARATVLGVAITAVVAVWGMARARGHEPDVVAGSAARVGAALAQPDSVLACPPLEAGGVEEPAGWLGAAAASLACRRATWMLGGRSARVLFPAALLGLATQPARESMEDPWERQDARAASLAAARKRAAALLAGHVRKRGDLFVVTLHVERSDGGAVSEEATAEADALHVAVRGAMEKLEAKGDLPVAKALDPEVVTWTGVTSPAAGALLAELTPALQGMAEWTSACGVLEAHARDLGQALVAARRACDTNGFDPAPDEPLDETSTAALALTAVGHFEHPARNRESQVDVAARAGAVAARLAQARATERSSMGRVALGLSEARLLVRATRSEEAAQVLLSLGDVTVMDWAVHQMVSRISVSRSSMQSRAAVGVAWNPDVPEAWAAAAQAVPFGCPAAENCVPARERLLFQRRAYDLGPHPAQASYLALRLLERGSVHEARVLGAELAARSGEYGAASALAMGLADAKEGWIGRGLERMRRALLALDRLHLGRGDLSVVIQTSRLAEVAGLQGAVGEEIAKHFVLADPHRLPGNTGGDVQIVVACMHAPRAVALSCIARIRELRAADSRWAGGLEGGAEFMAGAEHFARGDRRAAAAAWRRFAASAFYGLQMPVEVFDEAGEAEIARKLDSNRMTSNREYAGIHPAYVREAKRAAARGDRATARRLAQKVLDAWGPADMPIPAVAEMRALLVRLGR